MENLDILQLFNYRFEGNSTNIAPKSKRGLTCATTRAAARRCIMRGSDARSKGLAGTRRCTTAKAACAAPRWAKSSVRIAPASLRAYVCGLRPVPQTRALWTAYGSVCCRAYWPAKARKMLVQWSKSSIWCKSPWNGCFSTCYNYKSIINQL